jgi:hypothetical protein
MLLSNLRDFLYLMVDGWITLYRRNKLSFGIQSSYALGDVNLY